MTEETREKLRIANTGKTLSEDHKKKLSASKMGVPRSEESKRKQSNTMKGVPKPKEFVEKIIGDRNPFFGKKHTKETIEKLKVVNTGRKMSYESRRKNSDAQRGDKSHRWLGGISFEPYCVNFSREFKNRVRSFFDYTCVECGTPQNGTLLHVHHVTYNKKVCCDDSIPLFVPLCTSCHAKTHWKREYWEQHFTELINTYYGGRCYLTKEETNNLLSERVESILR
jgi:hypothetical protein